MKNFILFLITVVMCVYPFNSSYAASPNEKVYPVVIVGGGVGALTSSVYLARAQILPLVIEGKIPGGVITQSHLVQNWPGEIAISGHQLGEKMKAQALANGVEFWSHEVVAVDLSSAPYKIVTRDLANGKQVEIYAFSLILSMGTTPNLLHIPGEETYWGRGVTNCATCDGALYKNRDVVIVGGGDSAIVEAEYLSAIARNVYILVRKDRFSTQDIRRMEAVTNKKNVRVLFNTTLTEVVGDGQGVVGAKISKNGEPAELLTIDGVFLAIGSKPNTEVVKGQVTLDERGYIVVKEGQKTSKSGVYAIGDVADPIYKQAISAAGDGAKAAMDTENFLRDLQHKDSSISFLRPKETSPNSSNNERKIASKDLEHASGIEIMEITSEEHFKREIEGSRTPVVVDFYATWCGPCKRIHPDLVTGAKEASGKVKFLKINVDTLPKIAQTYQVRSMPTLVILGQKGKELGRKVGTDQILSFLKNLRQLRAEEAHTPNVEELLVKPY